MGSADVLERKVVKPAHDLHDFLWAGAKHDEAALLARLEGAAKALDVHLKARLVLKAVRPLLRAFEPRAAGADLFTFLWSLGNLAVASEARRRNPKEALGRATDVVVSNSIHLAAAVGRFDLVEMFEGGKADFDGFQGSLAQILEDRGVLPAEEMRSLATTLYDRNATWREDRPLEFQTVAATVGMGEAILHTALLVDALRAIGRYKDAPYGQLVPALRRILDRGGAHA